MNIQKIYNIDQTAASWTAIFEGGRKEFYSFCDVCDWAAAAHLNKLEFSIENN